MTSTQITYNPGILGDEELSRSFVVRQESLELILEALRENEASPGANRHLIMIGPRGIGKTMLVRRAAAAVRSDPRYSSNWYPLVFGEESYPVSTPGEFWLEALFHLSDQTGDQRIRMSFEELRGEQDDSRLRERALAQILDFSDIHKKRVLLVVENLNTLIGEQMTSDAAWDLRHTLLNEHRLMLLGTATNRFDEVENIGHAWFEMFSVHQMQPLTLDECAILWQAVTGAVLDANPLKAIRILTGGNPRLLKILATFAANHSFRQLMQQLVHLIDDHTEYFKGHLDALATKERRVFVALLERWDPVSAGELARDTRLSPNEVSALLGRLTAKGAVEIAEKQGRRQLYQAAERLYNIYYLMRRRGHPEGRVQAAVQFMITFYERDELVVRLADLAKEACALPEDIRKDHHCAYREILRKVQHITPQVLDCTPPEFFQTADAVRTRAVGVSGLIKEAHSLFHASQFVESERLYRRALLLDPKNAAGWGGLGAVLVNNDSGRIEQAEAALRTAIELEENDVYWHNLGFIYADQKRWKDAEAAFFKAVSLDAKCAPSWDMLAFAKRELGKYEEAVQACQTAIALDPGSGAYWNNIAGPLWELGRFEEAEAAFRKSIDLNPESSAPWQGLGHLLLEIGPPEKAEEVWSKGLELHPERLASCSVHLLELQLARGVDAASIIGDVNGWVQRSGRRPQTMAVLAQFLAREPALESLPLAETLAREAFKSQINSDTGEALSLVLAQTGKWEEAIEASKVVLDDALSSEYARNLCTEFLIRAAAEGWPKKALDVLQSSKGLSVLEPLAVGLQIYIGEKPVVAKEIAEVGADVAERIRKLSAAAPSDTPN